ncbi:MAG: DUF3108 domain-containing protein [Phycisphaerales bacterium]|nr:DUF3108 domain-containing protein [Hyphomonadaceae bacterium]
MLRFIQTIAGALIALGFVAAPARAETYRLNYEVAVLGVVVLGTASYEVTASPTRYAVRANLRTSGLARMFDQTEITATSTGAITGATINWSRYDISHAYSSKFRRIQMTRAGAVTAQIAPSYGDMGTPPATAAQQSGSHDPLTGVFALGRQIGAARACQGAVLVFDGRQHYRLSVAPIAQGTFNGGGYRGPALNCRFRYEPIAGFSTNVDRSRIPVADAWFALPAEPGFAAPLRLTAPTPLGQAQLDLRGYERIG